MVPQLPPGLGWLASVRARTTMAAVVVVTVALVAGSILLLVTLRHSLVRSGDDTARSRLTDLAALSSADALPTTLTVPDDDDIVQVVDQSGWVVAANVDARNRPPITDFRPTSGEPVVLTVENVPDAEDLEDYRVWTARAPSASGPVSIYVATNLEQVDDTIAAVRRSLVLSVPPLVALLALATWVLLGRALHPIEAIRAEVADISERQLDHRVPVPRTDDEVSRLARTMNSMLDRLQTASRRLRSFTSDASHELQSPLTTFRTQLEVGLAHPGSTDWPTTGEDLLKETQRMERLVRDLLYLARADSVAGPARTEPLDLDDVVLDEAARLRAGTRVTVDTSRVSAAPVLGSRDDLGRLVRNLLENAERHASSTVLIELGSVDGTVRLDVSDDGPGVPPEQRERIFDRFARLDHARDRASGGTGLGLAIVKEIAERHQGTVTVEAGRSGARFVVVLPSRTDADPSVAIPRYG